MTSARHDAPRPSEASETLDPQDWNELRAQGHRMLDDMIDYIATHSRAPGLAADSRCGARASFAKRLPRAPSDSRGRLSRLHRFRRALCDRQRSSGLHGLGAWRRLGRRHAGGDAGGRTQCQSRRPRSHADRGRAADRGLDAPDVRLSATRQRHLRHRHVDGQSDGGAGGADVRARQAFAAARHRRGGRAC